MKMKLLIFFLFVGWGISLPAQTFVPNYDEALVPAYVLPDPLVFESGTEVKSEADWQKRRAEIVRLFEREMYGRAPEWTGRLSSELLTYNDQAFDGTAITKQVKIRLEYQGRELTFDVLMHLPKRNGPVPVFLGMNFYGNHTTSEDPSVLLPVAWSPNNESYGIAGNTAVEASRGQALQRWPASEMAGRGYGMATVYCGDIDPDYDNGFQYGVHALMGAARDSSSWGTIAAWAWGLSRVMDYFETDKEVDAAKVMVVGHSRLGKAALWAGAVDQRFAIVISNNSGCGGAAISRRQYGETVERINNQFPHWFNDNFKKYRRREAMLPFDQHQLIALVAPRPVYVASAEDDRWADPKGEFLACIAASPVYRFLGAKGLDADAMPPVNTPLPDGHIGYHYRTGKHDITLYDWLRYADFADIHLNK